MAGAERGAGVVWDLDPLCQAADFPARVAVLTTETEAFSARWRGRLETLTAVELAEALAALEPLLAELRRLGTYVELREAADVADDAARDLKVVFEEAKVVFDASLRFFELEWLSLPDERAAELVADPALAESAYFLQAQRRFKPFKLTELEENALSVRTASAESAWAHLHHERLATTTVEFDSGDGSRPHTLDELRSLGRHPERALRRQALDAHYQALAPLTPVLAHCYDALVADRLAVDTLRGCEDPMLPAHLDNDLDPRVVTGLLEAVPEYYGLAQRWYRLKARLMGVEQLEYFDLNAPLGEPPRLEYPAAVALLEVALTDFDPEVAKISRGLQEGQRVDAELRPNKIGGAFCAPLPPDVGPYLLLNYADLATDAITLAHETGHAIHDTLASQAQPAYQAQTGVAVAEVPSTFTEAVLFERMLTETVEPRAKLVLLAGHIERTFGATFVQTLFARFEASAYATRKSGSALTPERLTEIWRSEFAAYLGDSVKLPDFYAIGWAYIPHFIFARFYTYAYTFAFLIALALVGQSRTVGFAARYRSFLAAGASQSPQDLLGSVGIDITDGKLWQEGYREIEQWIDEAERLADELS
jgi:oligoendopeptidase F